MLLWIASCFSLEPDPESSEHVPKKTLQPALKPKGDQSKMNCNFHIFRGARVTYNSFNVKLFFEF